MTEQRRQCFVWWQESLLFLSLEIIIFHVITCRILLPSVSSVAQSCPTLWPHGLQHARLPCPSHLLELAQTHVHRVSDAIQPSHPLSSPSPPAFNLSQRQGLSQWVSYSHQVAKVLELQLPHQSLQWIFRTDFLNNFLVWSPCSPRDSPDSSPTAQFKSINSLALRFLWPNSRICIWLQEKPQLWVNRPWLAKLFLCFLATVTI